MIRYGIVMSWYAMSWYGQTLTLSNHCQALTLCVMYPTLSWFCWSCHVMCGLSCHCPRCHVKSWFCQLSVLTLPIMSGHIVTMSTLVHASHLPTILLVINHTCHVMCYPLSMSCVVCPDIVHNVRTHCDNVHPYPCIPFCHDPTSHALHTVLCTVFCLHYALYSVLHLCSAFCITLCPAFCITLL